MDDTQQPSNTTTPTTTIDPGSSDATTFTKKTMAPRLPTSFQVKQMNEAAIDRLLKSGMFLSKAYVVQAALTALFEKLIEQSRATIQIPEKDPPFVHPKTWNEEVAADAAAQGNALVTANPELEETLKGLDDDDVLTQNQN